MLNKLLSHRLRGFSRHEHSPTALAQAIKSGVSYIEVDTRVTADNEVFIYHNHTTGHDVSVKVNFSKTTANVVSSLSYADGEALLSLREVARHFADTASSDQTLCIDIKDFGHEEEHMKIVNEAGIEGQVCFVTWIPQTIMRLHELGCRCRLILSQFNLLKLRGAGKVMESMISNKCIPLGPFVVVGRNAYARSLDRLSQGFQHVYPTTRLPHTVSSVLAASGGGICVPVRLVCDTLIKYCRQESLELWVYSAKNPAEFNKWASQNGVDVVFCDDAQSILNANNHQR